MKPRQPRFHLTSDSPADLSCLSCFSFFVFSSFLSPHRAQESFETEAGNVKNRVIKPILFLADCSVSCMLIILVSNSKQKVFVGCV